MEKKYIVVIVAVVVLWGLFMGFRHFNQKDKSQAHREDTYLRMIEAAQKSPRAGLYEMADAIKRYYADNKVYPSGLEALYPQYIPSRAFIEQIDWNYAPQGDNFYLSKSGIYNNQTMVAAIDRTMKPDVQTGGVTVAARRPRPERPAVVEVEESSELVEEAISESMVLEVMAERQMTVKEVDVVTAAVSPELKGADRPQITEEKVNVQTELSRIITLVGEESVSADEARIGYNLERYLVWKDLSGSIGVSNVEFPDRTDMYVAVRDRWYNVKRRLPEGAAQTMETSEMAAESPKGNEEIASELSRNYLVWKNAGEIIGVGDTQYPDRERLMIASPGGWDALERPSVPEPVAAGSVDRPADIHTLAADISREYLVWKNKDGSIGIGDTQYPEMTRLEVASAGGWSVLAEEPLPEKGSKAASVPKEDPKPLDEKLLAAGISGQYLMWKDKNGRIGFGNVEYPEFRNIAYVHTGGSWEKIVN